MELLIATKQIPKVQNGNFLYVNQNIRSGSFINGQHVDIDKGLYLGVNNKWVKITDDTDLSNYLDLTTYNRNEKELEVIINFQTTASSPFTVEYRCPYDLQFNSKEVSPGVTDTLTVSGNPYTLGTSLSQWDILTITLNTAGSIILRGRIL